MLFNSYSFLFAFLPIALLGYQLCGMVHRKLVIAWLGLASLAFYAYWKPQLVVLLLASISLNYLAGALISRELPNPVPARAWLTLAISADLGLLCYFKYLFPSLNFMAQVVGSPMRWHDVILPLGISFFTFTQIAFLVDLEQGIARQQDIFSYGLFVTFFPHLIAGPILHHKEMTPQFQQERRYQLDLTDVSVGLSWLVMGLAKKVLLADRFALVADPIFNSHLALGSRTAWVGALSYTLQLYFDFSGYSDMALGLARMFSIHFPLNFNSPFKSRSTIEFWQRWHMTLSSYIMSYLFTPIQLWVRRRRVIAGKSVHRKDMHKPGTFAAMIAFPMMTTLFIAGIWHGAGFQFIAYGVLHGSYLTVNHLWNFMSQRGKNKDKEAASPFASSTRNAASVLVTFLAVIVSFVFFRSRGIEHAFSILASMAGASHGGSPEVSIPFPLSVAEIAAGLFIVWFLPNTQQILSRFHPSLNQEAWDSSELPRWILWKPSPVWAAGLGLLFFVVLFQMQDPSTFLYFQF